MKEDQSKLIISIGIIISLIIITWTAMKWPLDFSNEYFWIFIVIAFIEAVIVIVVNEILKSKFKKKKKKKDNKKFQKANNILLIIIISLSSLLMLSVSGAIWMFSEINQYSKIYPSGTMTYSLDSYESELIIPSYSIIAGEYWDELIIFRSPKDADQLKRELDEIFASDVFTLYETDNGAVYYNETDDYTIVDYEVNEHLFMNTFNITYCDGLCD